MEEIKKVETVMVDYVCPQCKVGYLRPNGLVLMTFPAKYNHLCNNIMCDYTEIFSKNYPYVDYRQV